MALVSRCATGRLFAVEKCPLKRVLVSRARSTAGLTAPSREAGVPALAGIPLHIVLALHLAHGVRHQLRPVPADPARRRAFGQVARAAGSAAAQTKTSATRLVSWSAGGSSTCCRIATPASSSLGYTTAPAWVWSPATGRTSTPTALGMAYLWPHQVAAKAPTRTETPVASTAPSP